MRGKNKYQNEDLKPKIKKEKKDKLENYALEESLPAFSGQYTWLEEPEELEKIERASFKIIPINAISRFLKIDNGIFTELVRTRPKIKTAIINGECDRLLNEIQRREFMREQHRRTELKIEKDRTKRVNDRMLRSETLHYQDFLARFERWSMCSKQEKLNVLENTSVNPIENLQRKALELMNRELNISPPKDLTWNKERYKLLK